VLPARRQLTMRASQSTKLLTEDVPQEIPTTNGSTYATVEDVFAIVELLQRIFHFLPPNDLLAATRVCQYFHAAVRKSPTLRKSLVGGPRRHYSDRALSEWTCHKVQQNLPIISGKPAGHLYFRTPVLIWRLEHLPMFTVQLKGMVTQCTFLWHGDLAEPWKVWPKPSAEVQHTLDVVGKMYLSDPALPCTIECLREPKREVTVRPCVIGELIRLAILLHAFEPEEWKDEDQMCLWKRPMKTQKRSKDTSEILTR